MVELRRGAYGYLEVREPCWHPARKTPVGTLRQRASQKPAGEGLRAGSDLPTSPSSSPSSRHSSISHRGFPKFTGTFWKFGDVTLEDGAFTLKDYFHIYRNLLIKGYGLEVTNTLGRKLWRLIWCKNKQYDLIGCLFRFPREYFSEKV